MKHAAAVNPAEPLSAKALSLKLSFRRLALRGMTNEEILEFLGDVDADGLVAWLDDAVRDALDMLGPAAALVDWTAELARVQSELLQMVGVSVRDEFNPTDLQIAALRK